MSIIARGIDFLFKIIRVYTEDVPPKKSQLCFIYYAVLCYRIQGGYFSFRIFSRNAKRFLKSKNQKAQGVDIPRQMSGTASWSRVLDQRHLLRPQKLIANSPPSLSTRSVRGYPGKHECSREKSIPSSHTPPGET